MLQPPQPPSAFLLPPWPLVRRDNASSQRPDPQSRHAATDVYDRPRSLPTAATAGPVARARSLRLPESPALALGPAFRRSTAAFPCSSRVARARARLVVPADAR